MIERIAEQHVIDGQNRRACARARARPKRFSVGRIDASRARASTPARTFSRGARGCRVGGVGQARVLLLVARVARLVFLRLVDGGRAGRRERDRGDEDLRPGIAGRIAVRGHDEPEPARGRRVVGRFERESEFARTQRR